MTDLFPRTPSDTILGNGWTIDIDFMLKVQKIMHEKGYHFMDAEMAEDMFLTAEKVLGEFKHAKE